MNNTDKNLKEKLEEFVQKVEDRTNSALDDSLMDDDAKGENFNIDYTDIVKNSTKAKMSKLPWLIAIFLILIIAIMLGSMFFKNNPKTLFTQTIDGLFTYLENNINDNVYDIMDGNISLDYTMKSNDKNASVYEDLSKISWSADYIKDNAGNQLYADIKTTYGGNDFVNGIIYGDGKSTYVYSESVNDKFIKLNSNKLSYFVNGNDVKIILKGINQAVDKVIADEKIYGNKENLDIDGKVIKTYKSKIVIDSKNRKRVSETFINTLKANDELVNVLAKMKNVKTASIKESLDKYLTKLKKELQKQNKVEISVYVDNKNSEFIKAEILGEKGNINIVSKDNDKYTYSIYKNDDGILSSGEFSFTVNENKTKYTFNLYYKSVKNNQVLFEGNFDLKYTSKKANEFKKVDVSETLDLGEMNEIEKFALYTKIYTDPNLSKFLPIIKKVV